MIFDDKEMMEDNIRLAVIRAVDLGWLELVNHGFCFYCNAEKPVFDVVTTDAPVQPPRCMECFISMSEKILQDMIWEQFVEGH